MQQDLKISFEGLLSEEIDIINDWYANYSKFDRNVSLFDAQEVKSYSEHMQFMKEEYENLSFYDDFLLFLETSRNMFIQHPIKTPKSCLSNMVIFSVQRVQL